MKSCLFLILCFVSKIVCHLLGIVCLEVNDEVEKFAKDRVVCRAVGYIVAYRFVAASCLGKKTSVKPTSHCIDDIFNALIYEDATLGEAFLESQNAAMLFAEISREGMRKIAHAATLVTVGAAQSNHCRQTAAAAAVVGLRCALVLSGHPPPRPWSGNLLLHVLLGAELHWAGDDHGDSLNNATPLAVEADGQVTSPVAQAAMDMLEVDPSGFDMMDRKLLLTIIEKFDGGPVGVDSLSAAIGEERGTIEDVLEPYLIQQGFIMRTPRGRMATRNAWLHCGLTPPTASRADGSFELFSDSVDET